MFLDYFIINQVYLYFSSYQLEEAPPELGLEGLY